MIIERGDSILFGEKWCLEHGREYLTNKVIKLTPQYFEDDNGLYCFDRECPGIYDEENEESDSIYHLFGNKFERLMDCEIIKGNDSDKEYYQKLIQDKLEEEARAWEEFIKNNGVDINE